jgi:glycerol-3-phosphate dehydrogenase
MGAKLNIRKNFTGTRPAAIHFSELNDEEKCELIKKDPAYGKIICRCETITEGEIIDAIHRPLGAKTLDSVKRRTRAGMGRCQGGFCSARVTAIISRELGIDMDKVTKNGGASYILTGGRR